jgi:hypothetical protein
MMARHAIVRNQFADRRLPAASATPFQFSQKIPFGAWFWFVPWQCGAIFVRASCLRGHISHLVKLGYYRLRRYCVNVSSSFGSLDDENARYA